MPALGGRVDGGLCDLAERALGERRERADLLDLVTEQLDAQRLTSRRREHVDEAAANGELAALLDPFDPLVARRREVLGECVDARLVAGRHLQRRRTGGERRQSLGDGGGRRADEPAAFEHRERTGALADEVRRRLEPRPEPDAARREEADRVVAEEPRGRLGGVARVGVLRDEEHEPPSELLVQRRDDERQHRLGNAGARGQRGGELLEPLLRAEALDEAVENGTVHDDGPNAGVRPGRHGSSATRPGEPHRRTRRHTSRRATRSTHACRCAGRG